VTQDGVEESISSRPVAPGGSVWFQRAGPTRRGGADGARRTGQVGGTGRTCGSGVDDCGCGGCDGVAVGRDADPIHAALGGDDPAALLAPLFAAGPSLRSTHPALADEITELDQTTARSAPRTATAVPRERHHDGHTPGTLSREARIRRTVADFRDGPPDNYLEGRGISQPTESSVALSVPA
jgi:hypothetical protein